LRRRPRRGPPEGPVPPHAGRYLRGDDRGLTAPQPRLRARAGGHALGPAGAGLRRGPRPRRGRLHHHRGRPAAGARDSRRPLPAGLALFAPDHLKDDFRESAGRGGGGDPSGAQASFTQVTWDPDPADDWIRSDYEFTLRGADGAVQVVRESHRLGAFSLATWERLLREAGFDPAEPPAGAGGPGARPPAHLILGRRPGRG